jgi:Neuraminidase (sialidase)
MVNDNMQEYKFRIMVPVRSNILIKTLILLVLFLFPSLELAYAQEQYPWSPPSQIPTNGDTISRNTVISDEYGYVHLFWFEAGGDDTRVRIMYSRYDGQIWTTPNDVFAASLMAISGDLSAYIDLDGILHLVWTDTINMYYSFVPVQDSISAWNWSRPVTINTSAQEIRIKGDKDGILHIVYASNVSDAGVSYIRSEDEGMTWSSPDSLDPDKPSHYSPKSLNLEIDEQDGLHAVWYYYDIREDRDDWIRYAHSLDGGITWSNPLTIDEDKDQTGKLMMSGPVLMVSGSQIHIVWGAKATNLIHRSHKYSDDRGLTWSETVFIFGDLHGQAWDGMAVDGAGRVHFLGQIRYPQGIYHSYWDQNRWVRPELVYLIAINSNDPIGDRIHAHFLRPVFRLGNQLVVAFTPNARVSLFVLERTLDGLPARDPLLLPTSAIGENFEPDQTIGTTQLSTDVQDENITTTSPNIVSMIEDPESPRRVRSISTILLIGITPGLLFVMGMFFFFRFQRRSTDRA